MRMLLLLLALVLLVGWWLQRRRTVSATKAAPGRLARSAETPPSDWHAVAIKTGVYACDAARKLEGRRFLATEAPRLPLAACGRETCECRFQHYADRRTGRDRRSPFASGGMASGTGKYEQERRRADGRRADDE